MNLTLSIGSYVGPAVITMRIGGREVARVERLRARGDDRAPTREPGLDFGGFFFIGDLHSDHWLTILSLPAMVKLAPREPTLRVPLARMVSV